MSRTATVCVTQIHSGGEAHTSVIELVEVAKNIKLFKVTIIYEVSVLGLRNLVIIPE